MVLSAASLPAQEEEESKPAQPERIVVGRRWLLVQFPCGELKLKAWLFVPRGSEDAPTAAVLRIPAGGNLFAPAALGIGTVPEIEPYYTAGYVTMVMSFRGTLQNGGNFNQSRSGLDDVLAALEFLKKQPEVDPSKIFVAGHSSAASLTLRVSQVSDIPCAVAAFSPASDWTEFFKERLEGVSEDTRKYLEDSSPLTHAARTKCPVLLTHGTSDKIVPVSQSERMADKLKEAKKACEFIRIPGGDHYNSMLRVGIPLSLCWFSEIDRHGKTTELYEQFRDNLLKNLAEARKAEED
jgi:dipeptidyl aminopeptidase/acylaminoacyl peptidase